MKNEIKHPSFNRTLLDSAINAARITWEGRKGSACWTDIFGKQPMSAAVQQIYNDAADCGFVARSPRTGLFKIFYYDGPDFYGRGENRELSSWSWRSEDGFTIELWND